MNSHFRFLFRIRVASIVVLLLPAFLPAQNAATVLPDVPFDTLKIVVIGSSTAAGSGAKPRDLAWVPRYRRYLNRFKGPSKVINLAHGGYTSFHLQPDWCILEAAPFLPDSARNVSAALAKKPDAIIMNLPTNDIAERVPLITVMDNFERIAHVCDSAHIALWITTTQPRNFDSHQQYGLYLLREWILARFADQAVDFWEGLATNEGGIMPLFDSGDGIHVNNAGHALLLERIIRKNIPATVLATSAAVRVQPAPTVFSAFVEQNPFTGSTAFHVNIPRTMHTAITIGDVLEDTRRIIHYGILPRGRHTIPAQMDYHPPGVYVYKIEAGTEIRRGKLIKLPE